MSSSSSYVLGSDPAEIARLDRQAAMLAHPTSVLLRSAGLRPGMRVLDLGTGLGHVAQLVAELVGPEGEVVGVDQSAAHLEVAERRRVEAGLANVRFVEGDVHAFRLDGELDAVVGRLILFHLPRPEAVLRHHAAALRTGGVLAVVDYDAGTVRAEPRVPLVEEVGTWIIGAFRSAGADPMVGARLGLVLRAAGLADVTTFGLQAYLGPNDPAGPALLAGVARALAPVIVSSGLATDDELAVETLEQRLAERLAAAGAVLLPPAVVGAWGRRA